MNRFIGAIVGDVVGSVYEFNNHRSKDFPMFSKGCFATDDSIMTLGVAQALMDWTDGKGGLADLAVKNMQKLGQPYPSCGFGGRFFRWMYSSDPKPYNSFGNGAAMRVSSVAYVADSIEEVKEISEIVTAVSHNHPEGIKGAEATAVAVWMALNGCTSYEIRNVIQRDYYDLNFTLDEIRETYRFNETCQDTVPQAIMAFLEARYFEDAIRNAISIGGDSDTLAAITGAIAGAYYGVPDDLTRTTRDYLDRRLRPVYDEFCNRYDC